MAHRGKSSMRKFKKALKGRGGRRVTKADYRELAGMLGSDAGPGIRKKANSGGRKLTKLQKKVRAAKKAADRRVAVALAKYLRQQNPGRTVIGARVVKGKAGRRTITPIFGKRGKR